RFLRMSDVPQTPPQPATEPNFAPYTGPSLETVKSIVASQFQVKDAFLDPYGIPTILVSAEPTREKFRNVVEQLRTQNLLGAIRATGDTLTIKVFQRPQIKPSQRTINLALFIATVVSVTVAGYLLWTGAFGGPLYQQLNQIISPGANAYVEAGAFAAGLMAIIGLHEFGHKAATRHHHLDATLPYFIPGPPPIGTFGALLTFLNIVPAWQLDGGHISRAVFGPDGHRIATYVGLGILLLAGFWPFALLVIVMMGFSGRGVRGVEPLDDVSPVSNSRKILYLLGVAMLVLTFAYLPIQL